MPTTVPVPSASVRRGRVFQPTHELELTGAAMAAVASITRSNEKAVTLAEARGPFGVPDFVMMVDRQNRLERRMSLTVPPILNEIDAGIVSTLSDKRPITLDRITHILQWSRNTIERRIDGLLRTKAISRSQSGSFVRHIGLEPVDEIIAVEMKIADWRRGIHQCRRYSIWADRYILVLDRIPDKRVEQVVDEVKSDGSGLFVDGDWIVRPRRGRQVRNSRSLWASEHMIAALGHQPSLTP